MSEYTDSLSSHFYCEIKRENPNLGEFCQVTGKTVAFYAKHWLKSYSAGTLDTPDCVALTICKLLSAGF